MDKFINKNLSLIVAFSLLLLPLILSGCSYNSVKSSFRAKIFLVSLEDKSKSSKIIGCGDTTIPVEKEIKSGNQLADVLQELLSIKTQTYGESGLYNALYQSDLKVASTVIVDGKATVKLTGSYRMGGVCDIPRFKSQLEDTVLNFPSVKTFEIFINDTPLDTALSLK